MNTYNVYQNGNFIGQYYALTSANAIRLAKEDLGDFTGNWTAELA